MAKPQFSAVPASAPARRRRRFTLYEANRTLPLVQRIVRDIVRVHGECSHLQASISATPRGRQLDLLEEQLEGKLQRLHDLVEEINQVGCELKDCSMGLIDFLARHQGRDIYLCWKLGEDRINYWHELHSGFAGRQPVSVLQEDR
ncbi:MAG: DUF2203 domain-containing protein [Phycisphaerae bacterium]|nr:DUF2203 domain-containing protein [Phycisphaerae bacterium]MDW8262087.1 DUF2203 domain-containing protein [Phycisphaerales bacterium]